MANLEPRYPGVLSIDKDDRQGCMWGILHVLHFHQWHNNVKKVLANKRIAGRHHHPRGGVKYSRLKTPNHDTDEAYESNDSEIDEPRTVEKVSNKSPTSKKPGRGRKKKLIAEQMSKEQDRSLPSSPSRFRRTESFHHLHPSHPSLPDEVREDGKHVDSPQDDVSSSPRRAWDLLLPQPPGELVASSSECDVCDTIISVRILRHNHLNEVGRQFLDDALLQDNLDQATEALSKLKSEEAKEFLKDVALYQSKEFLDALETLVVNKELLLKILQDPNYDLSPHFHTLQASDAKRGLTKSGSFPVSDSSSRMIKQNALKPMQKDIGFFEDYAVSILKRGQESLDVGQTSAGSMPVPFPELKKQGENRLVVNRFKNIRQKIKEAIRESKREGRRISMDAFLHKIPYGRRISKDPKREIVDKWREVAIDGEGRSSTNSHESDISVFSPAKGRLGRMRRAHSLSESLDRYSQLFESSFSKEVKPNISDRLKVTNDDGGSSCGSASKDLARILSLPDLGSYYSLRSEAYVASPSLNEQNSVGNTENDTQLIAQSESGSQDHTGLALDPGGDGISSPAEMVNDLHDDIANSQCEQEIGSTNNANHKLPQPSPSSVLESCFQEDESSPANCVSVEGSELKPKLVRFDELDCLANLEGQYVMDSPIQAASLKNVKVPSKNFDSEFMHVQVNKKDEADFNYVRDVLKLSGFSGYDYLGMWHSAEQPVDPSLFEEVEACTPLKSNHAEDLAVSNYDHQLLFDIINEVLQDIYDRSFFYCPCPLSNTCHIRPLPIGNHVLEEVWSSISWYLGSQPQLETSLDYVVARDLSKCDGWMNLQFDSECVGLELEEMILDDLLEEVIFS